jgi:hypothetical protein
MPVTERDSALITALDSQARALDVTGRERVARRVLETVREGKKILRAIVDVLA